MWVLRYAHGTGIWVPTVVITYLGTYSCNLPRYGYRYYTQYTSILSGDTYIKHLSVLPYSPQIQRYDQMLHITVRYVSVT